MEKWDERVLRHENPLKTLSVEMWLRWSQWGKVGVGAFGSMWPRLLLRAK